MRIPWQNDGLNGKGPDREGAAGKGLGDHPELSAHQHTRNVTTLPQQRRVVSGGAKRKGQEKKERKREGEKRKELGMATH